MVSEPARTGATAELIERAADSLELESGSDRTWCYFRALDMLESIFPPGAVLLDPDAAAALRTVIATHNPVTDPYNINEAVAIVRAALEGPRS